METSNFVSAHLTMGMAQAQVPLARRWTQPSDETVVVSSP